MSNKRIVKLTMLIIMVFITNILVLKYCNLVNNNLTISYKLVSDKSNVYQVFYYTDIDISEEKSQKVNYDMAGIEQELKFSIPKDTKQIRLDLGNQASNIEIHDVKLNSFGKDIEVNTDSIVYSENKNEIENCKIENSNIILKTNGGDPYIYLNLDKNSINSLDYNFQTIKLISKILICIIFDIIVLIFIKRAKSIMGLALEIKNNRTLIWNLAKNDFKTKYAGSSLGITWAFVQPIVTILVYWFVFQFGLKAGSPISDVPFVVWFITGIVPWFFFQEALLNATNCMLEYSYLVKKVVFKISILPIVKIISALFIHLVFIGFLFFVAAIYGFYPTQYTIQLVYYSFCTFCLILAISYATSAMIIFFKDLGQIINIILQIGMWMTPIMWSYTIVPKNLQWIVKLNPMYYVVEGYRDTFVNHVWFFQRYFQTIYFWIITLALFIIGTVIFKKLKPHFADVL
ncbi:MULTISPECIES: ABC transporter permease [Clostridium]|uniref:ABC transporter permease n=1 Tax=Clostridium TaxID=1485 RepID=UPI00051C5F2C|nr:MULTISPECIES: ABC transporter permease [Clostridium]MDB2158893.1 ABC transporter permease [Clostridium butyricum]MDU1403284.1 ABC transporter permease [Clostridium sp.]MDU4926834.1 ABC transporter permease [Clostridium sp.]MZI81701.1 ABC transporter permease [Clostridium butyricum]OFS21788.1 ABC transporter [Clostridium sp. HMSC19A10]